MYSICVQCKKYTRVYSAVAESGRILKRLLLVLSWDTVARGQGGRTPFTVYLFELFELYTLCVLCNTTNKSFLENVKKKKRQHLETKLLCSCHSTLCRPCRPSYRPCGPGYPSTGIEESTGILAVREPRWREPYLSFWAFG